MDIWWENTWSCQSYFNTYKSTVLNAWSFRGAHCGIGQYLALEVFWERMTISKQATKNWLLKSQCRKLRVNDVGSIRIALENFKHNVNINRAWELLQRMSKFKPMRLYVVMNWSSISHDLMKDVHNYDIKVMRKTSMVTGLEPNIWKYYFILSCVMCTCDKKDGF